MTNHEASNLAWEHLRAGRISEAGKLFTQVLSRDPKYAAALHGLAHCVYPKGLRREAIDLLTRAVRADPKRADAHIELAVCLRAEGHVDAAMQSAKKALQLDPARGFFHAALGSIYEAKGRREEAIESYLRAAELDPMDYVALVNASNLLLYCDRFEEAEAAARRALDAAPSTTTAHVGLGVVLHHRDRPAEAEEAFARALAIDPVNGEAHLGLSLSLLRRGEWRRGFVEYEWRFQSKQNRVAVDPLDSPRWDGSPLQGRTLLVQAEQGLGDTIQFGRFVPRILSPEHPVIFRVDSRLETLMKTMPGKHAIVASAIPPHDVHIPLLSLPRVLGIEEAGLSASTPFPYLFVDRQRVEEWAKRLPGGKMRIGICWAGNPDHVRDNDRSIPPAALAPLADVESVTWISLQKPARGSPPIKLFDATAQFTDFVDPAAIMQSLDLVLTVDTAMAHLAGALARPVWMMLPLQSEWRWLRERSDSPWYPTMRLFRQPVAGDWASVLGHVASALKNKIDAKE